MFLKRIKTNGIVQLLLRYLAEVIIIFLGITISFLFEQWREGKRQQKELIELSESLLTDIEALNKKLNEDLIGSTNWISQLDSLRIQRIENNLSDRQVSWFFRMTTGQIIFLFDPYSPTYMSAASSRLVNELPDSIKTQLYNLYRVQLPFFQMLYQQQQENITTFRANTMVPGNSYYYSKSVSTISPDLALLRKEIDKPSYGNFINQIILTEREVYKMNKDATATLERLHQSLKAYSQQSK